MDKWLVNLLILLVLLSPKVSSAGTTNSVTIDCGETRTGKWYQTDDAFIQTGRNKDVLVNSSVPGMNTLRYFGDNSSNCYNISSLQNANKYHVRAGFFYGNYDGLNNPPTFYLHLNGMFWASIYSAPLTGNDPVYIEAITPIWNGTLSVCLVQDSGIPFISFLEARVMLDDFYRLMDNTTVYSLATRHHYTGDKDPGRWPKPYIDDLNRQWNIKFVPTCRNISFTSTYNNTLFDENWPPQKVMVDAIQAPNVSDSIVLEHYFPSLRYNVTSYFVFYFLKLDPLKGSINIMISINGKEMQSTTVPDNYTCQVITVYPVNVSSPVNITISPMDGSTSPPIITAMEMFTAEKWATEKSNKSNSGRLQYNYFLFVLTYICFGQGLVVLGLL